MKITVPGDPVAWSRARQRGSPTRSGKTHFHAPKYAAWKEVAQLYAREAMRGLKPGRSPFDITIRFNLPVPKSWTKKKREAAINGIIAPSGRPDIDNFEKAVLDAFNGIVWEDDAQVVRVDKEKQYAEIPGVVVVVLPAVGLRHDDKF